MSTKPINICSETGQTRKHEVGNGHPNLPSPVFNTSRVEEIVQQMKELITENNELKEAMRQRNQAMKERFKELSAWKEKLKEEREFYETKFKEARRCLANKCVENEALQKRLRSLEGKDEGIANESTMSRKETQELDQLRAQVAKLKAEKADLVGIVSELQLKLNSDATEDSFVKIGMLEGEHQDLIGKRIDGDTDLYMSKSTEEAKKSLETEMLTVSQLFHPPRNAAEKREQQENRLQELTDGLPELKERQEERAAQTELEDFKAKRKEETSESVGNEVEALNLQVSALFRELQEAHAKVKAAEVGQRMLQEKCQILEREHSANIGDLDEKQQLLYVIKKLELQVESMQSEMKLEQAKTKDEKAKFYTLQDAYNKLLPELTAALQTVEELKSKEVKRVDKAMFEELVQKLDLAEKALASKQLQIDNMKQMMAKQEEELETMAVLRAQMEVYCSDFHAERAAREKIHEEKEQLATQLAYYVAEKQDREDLSRCSLAEMQTRHGTRLPSDHGNMPHLAQGREDEEWQTQPSQSNNIPVHSCPKCGIILPDIDTLQIHVMECII